MQITTKGRYAIMAMLYLAKEEKSEKPISLLAISEKQGISLSYLEQLFARLRKENLVSSYKGPGGGYILNRAAENISVKDIIDAVDENIDLRRCGGLKDCLPNKPCIGHYLWSNISDKMYEQLAVTNLKSVIQDYNKNILKELA